MKPGALINTRQSVVVTKQETVVTRNGYAPSKVAVSSAPLPGNDIDQLHAQLQPTDVELLYSRLPTDVIPTGENQEPLTRDQQSLHAKLIAGELERQGYVEDDDDDSYEQ